ncbi:PREDICTED: LOW QUALITY PROTEIN: interferon-like [Eurypyga helias]|uniref:LOW QUALITY PROTEIN: interferon-like n=1 Tax=Eurypyga helias TaxID=54383 RepID=UPI000529132B|nr:PREDICTED: LOW QUALITY PROTEIN: interferon-like [Eurypyga helias]
MAVPNTRQTRLRHGAPTLLLLLPALATALSCHHLRPHHATFPWDSLQLLQAMAPSPTQPCHHPPAPLFPARHQLLTLLQHHIHHLEQCLPAHGTLLKRQGPRSLVLSINKYFRDIQDFLRTHNHSACAWDHVRLQAHVCFQHMDTLMRQMKRQDTPALHQNLTSQMPISRQRRQPQVEHRS